MLASAWGTSRDRQAETQREREAERENLERLVLGIFNSRSQSHVPTAQCSQYVSGTIEMFLY